MSLIVVTERDGMVDGAKSLETRLKYCRISLKTAASTRRNDAIPRGEFVPATACLSSISRAAQRNRIKQYYYLTGNLESREEKKKLFASFHPSSPRNLNKKKRKKKEKNDRDSSIEFLRFGSFSR